MPRSERIAGATVTLEHAAFQTVTSPPGWLFQVNNDPSGHTQFRGHAIVGAAFLTTVEFEHLLDFSPAPGFACDTADLRLSITLDIYTKDRIQPVRLRRHQFGVED